MASLFRAQATRACANATTRAVRSVPILRHSFAPSSARPNAVPSILSRNESSLASARIENTPTPAPAEAPVVHNSQHPLFSSLADSLSPGTLKAITVKPFRHVHMSSVQSEVLPLLPGLADPYNKDAPPDSPSRDLLVKAKTGTGKTLAFLVPAIEARLRAIETHGKDAVKNAGLTSDRNLELRAQRAFAHEAVGTLILSPTRELATQIANEAIQLTQHHGFEVRLMFGGASKRMQMRDWMRGRRDIVVATPGRLRDLLNSEPEIVKGLSQTRLLVLDEADTLLDMGFRDDIEAIKDYLPPVPERQTFLFSATVSTSIQQVARSTLSPNHRFINCVSEDTSPVHAHVEQYNTILPSATQQIPHILRLLAHDQLSNPGTSKTIVFLPTTKMTQLFTTLIRELAAVTLPAGRNTQIYEIHSKKDQTARTRTSDRFRMDKSGASILVSSDVSARGVDYPGVTRVIQVGIPGGPEQYIHRVGRTGRAGTKGRGDLVLLPWEMGFVTGELRTVPLKPLTTSELTKQTVALAQKFDENPSGFFPETRERPTFSRTGRPTPTGAAMFQKPSSLVIEDIERNVSDLLAKLDDEAVKETFMSLLGYYMAKTPELRTTKDVVVRGCSDWSVDACGLPTPPYVSASFLQKLGLSDGRNKSFGQRRSSYGGSSYGGGGDRGGASWLGRGQQSQRGDRTSSWKKESGFDGADEYKSARYGQDKDRAPRDRDSYQSRGTDRQSSGYVVRDRSEGSDGFRGAFRGRSEGGFSSRGSREGSASRGGYGGERGARESYGSRR